MNINHPIKNQGQDKSYTQIFILAFVTTICILNCQDNISAISYSDDRESYFSIITDKSVYSWQTSESEDYIFISGILTNESDSIFYTRMGDGYNLSEEQSNLLIAGNSAGFIEKFNAQQRIWSKSEICMTIIEGTRTVLITSNSQYSLSGPLSKSKNVTEKGTYRICIEYYLVENPSLDIVPYRKYSNTFRIE